MGYLMEAIGKTKNEARDQILAEMKISEDQVDFDIVGQTSVGRLFKLGKGDVTVRAYANEKTKELTTETVASAVALTLIRKMGHEATVEDVQDVEGKAYIKLSSPKGGVLIGKRGKNLEAIQFLTDLMVSKILPEKKKIILDIGDYRAKRQESLEKLAFNLASKVVDSGRSKLLEPMNPFERRVIHLTLQDHQQVFTKSEGHGVFKKVRISMLPKNVTKEQFLQQEAEREFADNYNEEEE